jgi:hypothetical protein
MGFESQTRAGLQEMGEPPRARAHLLGHLRQRQVLATVDAQEFESPRYLGSMPSSGARTQFEPETFRKTQKIARRKTTDLCIMQKAQ